MAAGNYGPEIKAAMAAKPKGKAPPGKRGAKPPPDNPAEAKAEGDTPAELARDKARGIVEGSPRDEALDAQQMAGNPPAMAGNVPHPHQVAAATSIAHAILGNRGMR